MNRHEEITNLINDIKIGVENSFLGKIMTKDESGKDLVYTYSMQAFLTILASICPKGSMSADMTLNEPKENWQKNDPPKN